ncbi:MAG: hypothetical protein R3E02_00560 [Blastomonas sp.]
MTRVYLTIDTELSASHFRHHGVAGVEENFDQAIIGRTENGDVGIVHQMRQLAAHGLKAVFFIDPMPALILGNDIVKRMVHPVLELGFDVQLHAHTEWLALADPALSPVGGKTGRNMCSFDEADQRRILEFATEQLCRAGADMPVAFRAGNYGADDATLRALASLGFGYDTSFSPGIRFSNCAISLDDQCLQPVEHEGVVEVPIGAISAWGAGQRHAQITAISAWEMSAAIAHANTRGHQSFSLVSHSFELLCRSRRRINTIVASRFDTLCAYLGDHPDTVTATYRDDPPLILPNRCDGVATPLPHNPVRTAMRMGEQLIANRLFG